MNDWVMTILCLLTVCVASLSCGDLNDHNRLNNGCAGELKVLINIWYNMDSKAQKALLAIAGGGSVEVQSAERRNKRVNLRIDLYPGVQPTDSKCQVASIIRLPHTKTKMQYGQCGSLVIPNARNALVQACTQ